MNKDRLIIFDTTLRDGEQSPGASMTHQEKLTVAKALEKLKVDVIEAGFPISSPDDFASVKTIAETIKDSTICALARSVNADIDAAGEALKASSNKRIHTFIATSPIHMEQKLKMAPDEVIERAIKAVQRARQYTDNVEFSPEDAGRSDIDFLCRIIEQVIKAGATTINIPDTVGYNLPAQYGAMIHKLIEQTPNSDKAVFSTHCHNDLGLAVANSLAGVQNGARQVECTINGLGERAGNAALEEVVMAIRTRQDIFEVQTRLDTEQILNCSRLVSSITGFPVQPNKAIVGVNAFAHESGIHQDGVLKNRETYEIMRAQDVGWDTNRMVLGKHSGRAAFKSRCHDLGIEFEDDKAPIQAFEKFKDLADKKHEIFDEDLVGLFNQTRTKSDHLIKLVNLEVLSKFNETPQVRVTIAHNNQTLDAKASGNGPVEAAFNAIEAIVASGSALSMYSVHALHEGADAQGTAKIRLEKAGQVAHGQGTSTDILAASTQAYVQALNRLNEQH